MEEGVDSKQIVAEYGKLKEDHKKMKYDYEKRIDTLIEECSRLSKLND